jgi:probable rRNA maturation factor
MGTPLAMDADASPPAPPDGAGGLVDTLAEDPRWEALRLGHLAERAAGATLRRLGLDPGRYEISLLGCSDARIAELNSDFRGKPQPTNVLSWPSAERGASLAGRMPRLPAPGPSGLLELGDVAIAWETCAREAEADGIDPAHHVTHLLVHATLHLLGFDHETEADAELMEGLEREVMGSLGVADADAAGAQGAAEATPGATPDETPEREPGSRA